MRNFINKCSNCINKLVIPIGCVFFLVLVVATIIQVLCRYFLKVSVPWSEELARFCFIWATMLGASVLVKTKGHPAVDALTGKLKGVAKNIQELFVCAVMLVVCYIGIQFGFQLVSKTLLQLSPALRIPYGYIYLSFPVGCIIMFLHLLAEIANRVGDMCLAKKEVEQ